MNLTLQAYKSTSLSSQPFSCFLDKVNKAEFYYLYNKQCITNLNKVYKTVLFFYSCCFAFFAPAQNLLLNGDFEEYWECPDNLAQLNLCKHAFNPIDNNVSTSDYFNLCSSINFLDGMPYSGNGYVGVVAAFYPYGIYSVPPGYCEYIQINLSENLIENEEYHFEFFVKLSERSGIAIDCIGIKFVEDSILYDKLFWETQSADWENIKGNYIDNIAEWKKIEGRFIAKGNEKWLIVGNFCSVNDFSSTVFDSLKFLTYGNFSYIFIDKFAVSPSVVLPNIFTPNNDGKNDLWTIKIFNPESINITEICLYNRWGKLVFKAGREFTGWDGNYNGQPCSEGTYFATVLIENKSNNSIKKLSGNITLLR
ncbi:MAG: gliding motility-associated C-terminal domain-containing protein [Flavobacteriales bacterium]|nr:gliding motility-associated C-terminal domain-containing protein [Flavobacteriales bacterium]